MVGEGSNRGKFPWMFLGIWLFALAFCLIQMPATLESVKNYTKQREWDNTSAKVISAEYVGTESDGDSRYSVWKMVVSYEYQGQSYEAVHPETQRLGLKEDGTEKLVGQKKLILVNPENPMEIGEKILFSDLMISIGLTISFILGSAFAFMMLVQAIIDYFRPKQDS